jgi:serpin B
MRHALLVLLAVPAFACQSADPRQVTSVDADLRPIVDGSNAFTWDMLREARSLDGGNVFVSPFSIVTALSMVYAGANGETEAQIADAMSVPEGGESTWHEQLGALVADLSGDHARPYTLYTADRVWGQTGYPIHKAYGDILEENYLAPWNAIDFVSDPASARKEINGWVADETKDRIQDLFQSDDITADTRLVLANAIYFYADWKKPFHADETKNLAFTLASGDDVKVPTMTQSETFDAIVAEDGTTVLELPYDGDDISMVVLLPAKVDGLDDLLATLDDARFNELLDSLYTWEELDIHVPSFELDFELPLADALMDMGVTDAFDPALADFSGIIDPSIDSLWIQAARHKAFVRVDEQGTEAAAATGFSMSDGAYKDELTQVHLDHPFVYLIRDNLTGTVLFSGLMTDPSKAALAD